EGKKSKPRALLVFGAPCSGKTTFAEKFAKKFDLAYYDFDNLKAEARLTRKTILLILTLLSRTKKTLVIEGGVGTEKERVEMRNILNAAGYNPTLIWVQTDTATIRTRMKTRYKSVARAKEVYNSSIEELEAPADEERPIILSGKHTFETQTKHVLSGLADAEK
ncbi:MAG: AAA family ATPase, partial [Candidatus Saccharibacteria bacterium]|nr:AAA family ATPase [Candidatus Saccharibacteria bacterium]